MLQYKQVLFFRSLYLFVLINTAPHSFMSSKQSLLYVLTKYRCWTIHYNSWPQTLCPTNYQDLNLNKKDCNHRYSYRGSVATAGQPLNLLRHTVHLRLGDLDLRRRRPSALAPRRRPPTPAASGPGPQRGLYGRRGRVVGEGSARRRRPLAPQRRRGGRRDQVVAKGVRGERWRQRRRNRRAGHIVVGGKRAAAAQERADEPRTQA